MRVICKALTMMGRRRAQHGRHLSSMLGGQNIRWEVMNPQVVNIMVVYLFGIGIKSLSSFTCTGGFLLGTILIAIVMAGEERGGGTRVFNSFNNMLLCLSLLGTIQNFDTDWAWGGHAPAAVFGLCLRQGSRWVISPQMLAASPVVFVEFSLLVVEFPPKEISTLLFMLFCLLCRDPASACSAAEAPVGATLRALLLGLAPWGKLLLLWEQRAF